MKVRYELTVDYDIDDELIKQWAEDAVKYNYQECIADNLAQCIGEDFYMDTGHVRVLDYKTNIGDIEKMVENRGKILLTNPKEAV